MAMANLKARVAYLQGLTAGLDMPGETKEAKLLAGVVDALAEFAEAVDDLRLSQERLEDYLESIDEDLYGLERDIYPDDDDLDQNLISMESDLDQPALGDQEVNRGPGGETV
jgi:hypothetical protein